jgi:hypothetical protein
MYPDSDPDRDADQDTSIFVSYLQDIKFCSLLLFEGTFTSFSKHKKS